MDVALTDPTHVSRQILERAPVSERIALRFIHDARDIPFLKLMVVTLLTVVASGVLLFVPGMFRWWLAALHVALMLYLTGPFILMLHNTSHRRLFKGPWSRLNLVIPWVIGPFFGESPETYFSHHVGMHHPENNVGPDVSCTLDYQRDQIRGFARYFFRFLFVGILDLSRYFVVKKRPALLVRTLVGESMFFVMVIGLCFLDWRASLMVFALPCLLTRFAMMAGNWGQHAFVDQAEPANSYRNSITCINTGYNRRCFNDGYHIGHHVKQTRHWTEMPGDFRDNVARYDAEGAIVFEGIDFFVVWLLLMLKRYDTLASHIVQLGEVAIPRADTIAMLKSRTRWTRA